MTTKNEEKQPIAPVISKLEINETVTYPSERYNAVRNTCSNMSISNPDMRFSTCLDREARTVTVTRVQ